MVNYNSVERFHFLCSPVITALSKLPSEAVHKDGTGCERSFYGEQKEKDNV